MKKIMMMAAMAAALTAAAEVKIGTVNMVDLVRLHPNHESNRMLVKTTDTEIPELRIKVAARVSGGLSVSPQAIELPREGKPAIRQVLIRPEDIKRPLKVLSAETKPRKWGEVKIVERPLNGWQIRIEGIDPEHVRQFSKRPFLEVTTDFPGMETFSIPLVLRHR